jgi:hypothetical protein
VPELLVWNLAFLVGATLTLLGVLAGLHRFECRVSSFLSRRIGWRASLYPTAIVGVPVHELSHIVAAKLFGHRVVGFSLFEPDPTTGTLGYVRHAYRRRSPWQLIGTFFIGVAPFVAGATTLIAIGATMVPAELHGELLLRIQTLLQGWTGDPAGPAHFADLGSLVVTAVASVRAGPWLPLQLYLAVAVAAHMAPSPRDLAGGLLGGLVLAMAAAGLVTLLTAAKLTALPLLALLVPITGFALLAVALQTVVVAAVALCTRPARRRVLASARW